jgi:hypothetical protein
MGESIVILWTARSTKPYAGMKPGRPIEMKADEVLRMGREVEEIAIASPELTYWGRTLEVNGHRVISPVAGVIPKYERPRNMIPMPGGRFIDPLDIEQRRRVIFIGNELKAKLFEDVDEVGKTLFVDGRPFTVIGSLTKKIQTGNYSGPDEDRAFIPYTTFISMWGNRDVSNTVLVPTTPGDSEAMKSAVYRYLGQHIGFDPEDEAALQMWDTVEMDRFVNWFFWGIKALMGLGGVLTLGAGGIGVANIMFLVVRERTREIGVRMCSPRSCWKRCSSSALADSSGSSPPPPSSPVSTPCRSRTGSARPPCRPRWRWSPSACSPSSALPPATPRRGALPAWTPCAPWSSNEHDSPDPRGARVVRRAYAHRPHGARHRLGYGFDHDHAGPGGRTQGHLQAVGQGDG